ncbi:flagellar FliJ family protein [Sulfurospirillum sp. T05]|uniref:Flagellar FliJ protein n=1 Tax=Sulfurospirillum tamanense TaxID=2813362 RepID=A0ABS2WNP5_9BACT|nr:flagellar export protein FliJ [Sulfurospirillum tamanensis]MBN2963235.1 flagellar FliJ family protein [Sulfurospirillum tamanensis]
MDQKFSAIAKVKKQLLDAKEAALMEARTKVSRIEKEIFLVEEAQRSQQVPAQGMFCDLLHVKAFGERLYRQKQDLYESLEAAQLEANACLHHYQEARRDFEKIKYLEEEATSAMLKRLKKQEQLTLDEVALQLYALGGKVR